MNPYLIWVSQPLYIYVFGFLLNLNERQLDPFHNFKPEVKELCKLIICASAQIQEPIETPWSVITLQGRGEGRYQTWFVLLLLCVKWPSKNWHLFEDTGKWKHFHFLLFIELFLCIRHRAWYHYRHLNWKGSGAMPASGVTNCALQSPGQAFLAARSQSLWQSPAICLANPFLIVCPRYRGRPHFPASLAVNCGGSDVPTPRPGL